MAQYQNFCFSKKKNVNQIQKVVAIDTVVTPIQSNFKPNMGKKKDLSRNINFPFFPLKRQNLSIFSCLKRVSPVVDHYSAARGEAELKKQAKKMNALKFLNFYKRLKNFNRSKSYILVKSTTYRGETLNLIKKTNQINMLLGLSCDEAAGRASNYFKERKNLSYGTSKIKKLISSKQKFRIFLLSSIKRQYYNTKNYMRISIIKKPSSSIIEGHKVREKYITKNLIKNTQNIPLSIVIIYLNMLSRVWPFFFALGFLPKYNNLFIKELFFGHYNTYRIKKLNFFYSSRYLLKVSARGVAACRYLLPLLANQNKTAPADNKALLALTYKLARRDVSYHFIFRKIDSLFYGGLREKKYNLFLPFQPRLGSKRLENKSLINKNKNFYTNNTENKTIKSRLILRGYWLNLFILEKMQPYSNFFNLSKKEVESLEVKQLNFLISRQKYSNKFHLHNKSLWFGDTQTKGQAPTKRKIHQKEEKKCKTNKKGFLSYTGKNSTYLALWQLTKKKQNQNSLYLLFKKYWLITKLSLFFIKLKNIKKSEALKLKDKCKTSFSLDSNTERHLLFNFILIRQKNIKWLYLTEKKNNIKFFKNCLTNSTKKASNILLETSITLDY